MAYLTLYRKYRPRHFADIIGQGHITRALKKAVCEDRVGHAYLFSGTRGTGKTTTARVLARAVNCTNPSEGEPCGECQVCLGMEQQGFGLIELDAASNRGVDEIEELLARVRHVPVATRSEIFIVDEVHMLSRHAFNAFLKTLEEPPAHAIFILATTEPHKLPATIHSRCQHYGFRRVDVKSLEEHLIDIAEREDRILSAVCAHLVAGAGRGSVRDAMTILDQVFSYADGEIDEALVRDLIGVTSDESVIELVGEILGGKPLEAVERFRSLIFEGREPQLVIQQALGHFKDLLLFKKAGVFPAITHLEDAYAGLAGLADDDSIFALIDLLAESAQAARWDGQGEALLEVALIRAATGHFKIQPPQQEAAPSQPAKQSAPPGPELKPAPRSEPKPEPRPAPKPEPRPAPIQQKPEPSKRQPTLEEDIDDLFPPEAPAKPAPKPAEQAKKEAPQPETTPATEPEPPKAVASPGGNGKLDLGGEWPEHIREISGQNAPLAALLLESVPLSLTGGVLKLGFPENFKFTVGVLQTKANIDWLKRFLRDKMDSPVEIKLEASLKKKR